MLLLVVQPQGQQIALRRVQPPGVQPGDHPPVDLAAIVQHCDQGRAGHQTALAAPDPGPQRLVVGVEQGLEPGVDRFIVRLRRQDHGLEEPAGMGQMPFARTAVRHGLGLKIFRRKSRSQGRHGRSHPAIGSDIARFGRLDPGRCIHSR